MRYGYRLQRSYAEGYTHPTKCGFIKFSFLSSGGTIAPSIDRTN